MTGKKQMMNAFFFKYKNDARTPYRRHGEAARRKPKS